MDTAVNAWADVETQYRDRSHKIIALINTIRQQLPGDAIAFTEFEKALNATDAASMIANNRLDMSAEKLRTYIQQQSVPLEFLRWVGENKERLHGNLLQSLQSALERSENGIRQAKLKYNKAAEAYNRLETDASKELPKQF